MTNKQMYESPDVVVVELFHNDVITTSGGGETGNSASTLVGGGDSGSLGNSSWGSGAGW